MRRYVILSSILIGIFFLVGCGDVQAPDEATITIHPPDPTVVDAGIETVWDTYYFSIVVEDENGIPLNDVEITITFPWAEPGEAGLVRLYDGDTREDSPMKVVTDKNGTYYLRFDYLRGGKDYYGNLQVRSGNVFASTNFTVSAGSTSE